MSSAPLRLLGCRIPSLPFRRRRSWIVSSVWAAPRRQKSVKTSPERHVSPCLCVNNGSNEVSHVGDVEKQSTDPSAPGRMGYAAAVQRFLKVMAMVWAGSQITKVVRVGGALALAPFVGRGLSWITIKLKFDSEGKAFGAIVCLCFGLALLLFFGLTLLWA